MNVRVAIIFQLFFMSLLCRDKSRSASSIVRIVLQRCYNSENCTDLFYSKYKLDYTDAFNNQRKISLFARSLTITKPKVWLQQYTSQQYTHPNYINGYWLTKFGTLSGDFAKLSK